MSIQGKIAVKAASQYRKDKAHEAQAAQIKSVVTAGKRRKTASMPKPRDKSRQALETQLQTSKQAVEHLYKQVHSAMRNGRKDQAMRRMELLVMYRGKCLDLAHAINNSYSLPPIVERDETYNVKNVGKAENPMRVTSQPAKKPSKPKPEQFTVSGTQKAGRSWVK